jgi:hypothetical protein
MKGDLSFRIYLMAGVRRLPDVPTGKMARSCRRALPLTVEVEPVVEFNADV